MNAVDAFQADLTNVKKWCLDSEASLHFCKDPECFTRLDTSHKEQLNLATSSCAEIKGRGSVMFSSEMSDGMTELTLADVLHVPSLRTNLLSIGNITDKVVFRKENAYTLCLKCLF